MANGAPRSVTDQTGDSARPANPAALADTLTRALAASTTEQARLRATSRHLATTRHNHDKTIRSFLEHGAPLGPQEDRGRGLSANAPTIHLPRLDGDELVRRRSRPVQVS